MHHPVHRNTLDDNASDSRAGDRGRPAGQPEGVRVQAFYDSAFRELVGFAWGSAMPEQHPLSGYVQRIVGSVFCGAGIDPSVVRFATARAADQWGRDEDEVDVMVGDRLLRTTSAIMADLR